MCVRMCVCVCVEGGGVSKDSSEFCTKFTPGLGLRDPNIEPAFPLLAGTIVQLITRQRMTYNLQCSKRHLVIVFAKQLY